eukprot:comp21072_c1_seq1/m.28382 comp21072_c1_seq1/g.28382  ORF comp21072_c1_seq1/g.28382 comp21072_c1_seq1/m.28382 type:complete len:190 (-) comp21072_c1_seq1:450-1019(-)
MAQDRKGTKVYVGNLDYGIDERDLRDMFNRYGRVNDVWIARKPPGFGFVWFDDSRDADDAVRAEDGKDLRGKRMRVEISSGGPRGGGPGRREFGSSECYQCGERGHFARECPRGRGGGRRRSRSRSRSPPRRRSRSRSRSPRRRSFSRSPRRSPSPRRRSPSPDRRGSPPPRSPAGGASPPRRSPSPRD